jgi:hypothetical protein
MDHSHRIGITAKSIFNSIGDVHRGRRERIGYVLSKCFGEFLGSDEIESGMENIAELLRSYDATGAQRNKDYFLIQLSRLYEVGDEILAVNPLRGASKLHLGGEKSFMGNYAQGGMLATNWKAFARDQRRAIAAHKTNRTVLSNFKKSA